MGLSEYMKKNTYEMLTNESYDKSKFAQADIQNKNIKKQNGVVKQAAQGFSTGVQSRIYGNQMIADSPIGNGSDRPMPSTLDNINQNPDNDLQVE